MLLYPHEILHRFPKRAGESPQGYALRVLKESQRNTIAAIFDESRHIAEREARKREKQREASDALSNVQIEISVQKETMLKLLQ